MESETPIWLDDCLAQVKEFRSDPDLQRGIKKIWPVAALFDEGDQRLLFAKLAGLKDISAFAGPSVSVACEELEKDREVLIVRAQVIRLYAGVNLDTRERTLKELFGAPSVTAGIRNKLPQESLLQAGGKAVGFNP